MARLETTAEVLRNKGVSRRDFMKFCALTAVAMGLGPGADLAIAQALSTKPRLPVLWINGLSCSCCTESFLRTAHPLAADIILSMIALFAMAGFVAQAEGVPAYYLFYGWLGIFILHTAVIVKSIPRNSVHKAL